MSQLETGSFAGASHQLCGTFLVELKSSVKTKCEVCRARSKLFTCSFSAATLSPVCWVARFPTNPPVPATASHHGGKSGRHLTTWPRPPDRQCTAASIRTFTASASRPSPCRAGRRGPVIPRKTRVQAHTVQRGLTVTSPGLPPTLWVSGTQNLSLHWWLMSWTDGFNA